jgi:glycosyltransferase involved in cell wall biosynthesis
VATPAGGTGEIVKDGDNGLLFAPGDHLDLAEKINCLSVDVELRRRLIKAGWRTIDERFSATRMIDRYERYFQELVQSVSQAA